MEDKVVAIKSEQFRKTNKITRISLAQKIGVSFMSVYSWEKGKTLPNADQLYKMSKILGVKMEELCQIE